MLLANTFCANAHKLAGTGFDVEEVIRASVAVAKRACSDTDAKVLLDVGPIGELLEPLGTLKFDEAYALYAQMIRAGAEAGAEGVFFETFSDLNELRAGVLAAKECSDLPVFASMTFEASGRTFLGCRADAAAMALDALGVDALALGDMLVKTYKLEPKDSLYDLIQSIESYRALRNPTNTKHRFIVEDTMSGLVPLASVGHALGIPTPMMDAFVNIASAVCGRDFWKEGRTAEKLGMAGKTLEEIQEMVR